ncbi:UNVERIFIED_CONTAM: hypothetical protein PYX00_002429 [Menopon gallinae]|uniref:PDZ domain-containing protein n=1 Tax=Menopon gallinae TaxID=328185 RepID=A0AAW2IH80_9NEOP
MSNHTNGNLTNKPVVRLCHIVKWPDYDGYGFNLHADKNKSAQYIGKVDEGSPAQAAGLKEGDRIIEVNGINVTGDDHKQVVSKIKQNPKEAKLLVVDKESYEYFQSNGITITSTLPEVVILKMPSREDQQQVNGNKTPEVTESAKEAEEKQTTKLNFNMTVKEYRSKLASRKKYDPKKEAIDVKKKHEIIDKL